MPIFEITGTGKDTGRKRKKGYEADDEQQAKALAEADGIVVASTVQLPPEPPTERQLVYAAELGISVPSGVTTDELSDLISLQTWKDKKASPELQTLAKGYGVKVTSYSGKKLLFDRIFQRLAVPGREIELAAWFTYRVYRELVGGKFGAKIASPHDEAVQGIAMHLAAEPKIMQSICRYSGKDLIWFGRWTSPDGAVHEGGSSRTKAYRQAADLLRPFVSAEKRIEAVEAAKQYQNRPLPPQITIAPKAKGCLPIFLVGIGLVIGTAFVAMPIFAADLQYKPQDAYETQKGSILKSFTTQVRACMHSLQEQLLNQGMRNQEVIVDQSVAICAGPIVKLLASEPSVGPQTARSFAIAMAYDELLKIPGVVLSKPTK